MAFGQQSSAPRVSYVQFRAPKFDGGALGRLTANVTGDLTARRAHANGIVTTS
jgi:hypothetical protein